MKASVDESYRFLAAKYVRRQAKQLAEQLDGVRKAEDVEFVHQARVASRRLRAALEVFRNCFARKQRKRWRKQICRVTTGLGDARDKDVQIEFLCGVLHGLDRQDCYPGIARLLVQLEQQRELLQPKVLKAVDRLQASGILEEMLSVTKQELSEAKARKVSVQSPFTYHQTEKHVLRRLSKMLPYHDSLADEEDQGRHHAMRIAAKRLRYTVEISKPVYKRKLDAAVEAIKRVQSLLGEVHDCDVWQEHLAAFARAEREKVIARFGHAGSFARLEAGIEYLLQERRGQRRRVFRELVEYWQELQRRGQWEDLVRTLGQPPEQPGEQELPAQAEGTAGLKLPAHQHEPKGPGAHQTSAQEPQRRTRQEVEAAARSVGRKAASR